MILSHHFYYTIKPFIPWRLRMGLRRIQARRVRRQHEQTWPIDPSSAQAPAGWSGWPDGKQAAFVLTHDVESAEGLEKVRPLAELEMSLGFRSSFNFVPEGEYSVPASLRSWLISNGFEVGVHDLHHDGKLYRTRDEFRKRAARINGYVQEWAAAGYRSGFMLRNLDWHQDLDVMYDASTFDTDPFEPQPEGAGTIFPYWVPTTAHGSARPDRAGSRHSGYLQLPYTLPQDSTLFLLFREPDAAIWEQKLAWIVQNGGMALMNTHPDYMNFGTDRNPRCYPLGHYANFLRHVAEVYQDRLWRVVPRVVAKWYTDHRASRAAELASAAAVWPPPDLPLSGKRAAVLLYSYYPADPRPRRAAEAMAEAGMAVDVICLSDEAGQPATERIADVNIRRLPMGKTRAGKLSYIWQYGRFIASCFFILCWRSLRTRYELVHVHNMPDVLAFAALPAKMRGARVILDQHDPMPELMTSIYGLTPSHWMVTVLRWMERLSFAFVDQIITVNLACRSIFGSRSCSPEKIEVVMNSPNDAIFGFRPAQPAAPASDRCVIMYHGSIVERHGLDLAVEALVALRQVRPAAELRVYGKSNAYLEEVLQQAKGLGLADAVRHMGAVDQKGIARAIDECDIGIIPNRRSIFTEINTPTRIFEYLARGKPVIAPRSTGITDYFQPEELIFFELGDAKDLARQLVYTTAHPEETFLTVQRGQRVYLSHRWNCERARLLNTVVRLVTKPAEHLSEPIPARQ
jgi:glycosyltransferase involved in cell wall biosynthesis